jgi:hypothetical protein
VFTMAKILLPIDFSACSAEVARAAALVAAHFGPCPVLNV